MIAAGIGFRAGAGVASLRNALAKAGGGAQILCTVADKSEAAAFLELARELDLPTRAIARESLAAQQVLTHSSRVKNLFGTGSLAEAAALAGAGPGARLLGPRVTSDDGKATAALAEGA